MRQHGIRIHICIGQEYWKCYNFQKYFARFAEIPPTIDRMMQRLFQCPVEKRSQMKKLTTVVICWIFVSGIAFAEEGMWPPEQLPELAMELKALGLELDPQQMADLTEYPMNTLVSLGDCSASFVSPSGLVITNHHCAYGSIQFNSTAGNNLIEKGFLAESQQSELQAAPGSRVYVTIELKDVTEPILGGIPENVSGYDRYQEIDKREKEIIAECEKEPGYRCRVAGYSGGLSYSLVRQIELRDVRLVYAPASGIGNFGGDIDNWMWPRHVGDYSFFRAYVAPDGSPADYSPDNVPYKPKHFLKISTTGIREGDLVLVAGYPYSTDRYRLSSEVEDTFTWGYPMQVKLLREQLDILHKAVERNPEAAIKYASLDANLNNVLKNNQGMLENFSKSTMLQDKRATERELAAWINSDASRRTKFSESVHRLGETLDEIRKNQEMDFFYNLLNRSTVLSNSRRIYRLSKERKKPDMERESGYQERDMPRIRQRLQTFDRRYDPDVDKALFKHSILFYHQGVPADARLSSFDSALGLVPGKDASGAVDKKLAEMYAGTVQTDAAAVLALLELSDSELETLRDPFMDLAVALYESDLQREKEAKEISGVLQQLRPKYMEALIAFLKSRGKPFYPDANGTLRVTFGTVKGYQPRDAVLFTPFTTLEGVVEKDTGQEPFNTPPAALQAMKEKRYDRYRQDFLGSVPVNFLSTCDTTGGNSGSATLNGKGELVGLLFDGNYESMISDWDFLPEITRSIHVDMRYVLWLMEEVDKATWLLKEMEVN
jgi:hypothetical protein